jgi:gamma-glutamylcyclotransferase (GGCT)/AIG2-like uncharacterized protein YtfP
MAGYLFTYGTLHPGRAPAEIAPSVEKFRPVGEGFVPGVLYDLGDYPGAVLDPSSPQQVSGTVFQLPEDGDLLRQLDEYEGFNPDAPEQSLFLRVQCPVVLATGGVLNCWVYAYNGKPEPARIVASRTFRES